MSLDVVWVVLICSSYWVRRRLKIPMIHVKNLDFSVIGFQYINKLNKVDYIIVAFLLLRCSYNITDTDTELDVIGTFLTHKNNRMTLQSCGQGFNIS